MKDFQTRKKRMTKKRMGAEFKLADNDDFFGFSVNKEDASLLRVTAFCLAGIILLATMWWGLGQMQDYCMRVNNNDITLCE